MIDKNRYRGTWDPIIGTFRQITSLSSLDSSYNADSFVEKQIRATGIVWANKTAIVDSTLILPKGEERDVHFNNKIKGFMPPVFDNQAFDIKKDNLQAYKVNLRGEGKKDVGQTLQPIAEDPIIIEENPGFECALHVRVSPAQLAFVKSKSNCSEYIRSLIDKEMEIA